MEQKHLLCGSSNNHQTVLIQLKTITKTKELASILFFLLEDEDFFSCGFSCIQ